MITPKLIILPLLAATLTFILTPIVRRLTEGIGAIDCPDDDRKCHTGNIPSSGGVAIFFGFLLASLFFNRFSPEVIGFFIGGTIITGIGLLDDVFDLPPITKFFGQVLAALIVIYSGVRVDFIANPSADGTVGLGFLSLPFTFFWIVGMANAINFIDGLDGLAAGISGIAAWTLGFVALFTGRYDAAVLAFTIGAASFAFLPHNFSEKKKIFMGDSGSNFLGYSLAVVSIMGIVKVAAAFTMLIPMLILAVPIFDTLFAIVRRLLKKQSPFTPDSAHLHHRIMNKGFTAKQTTGIICGVSLVLSVVAVFSTRLNSPEAIGLFVGVGVFLMVIAWLTGIINITLSE
jgi:UDP-GlcNAc:undecaprenyl-phosphate GlcNAc-1-phosphate transferase